MIKFIAFRLLRLKFKSTLPKVSARLYNKLFSLTYRFLFI